MYSQQHYAISHLICLQKWIKSHSQRSSGHNGRLETSFFVVCWCKISGALEHDRLWQYFSQPRFLCSHRFLLESHSLPSAWISSSWGEAQSLNITRGTNRYCVLYREACGVQDDVTILTSAKAFQRWCLLLLQHYARAQSGRSVGHQIQLTPS